MGTGNMYIDNITGSKIEPEMLDIDDGITSIEELLWLAKNSKFFHSTILSHANKVIITENDLLKKSLAKFATGKPKPKTKK
jgi:hypothetical protein